VAIVIFSDSSVPVLKFLNPDRVRELFKFENPTPAQTLGIDTTEIQQCIYLRKATLYVKTTQTPAAENEK